MTEEIYKLCMMCSKVYEGDITKYNGNNVSHGICTEPDCISAYLLFTTGGDEDLAMKVKEELNKK